MTSPLVTGVLLWDKPRGKTSHDVVAAVRRGLRPTAGAEARRPRVGHAGTLDPFATGLLLVLLGRATRVQRFLMALPKEYEVVARLGARSSTGDPEGEIEETGRLPSEPLQLPTGRIRQRPPAHSAVKVGGQRAYALARRGEDVQMPEREVVVHAAKCLWRDGDRAGFRIACSSGTYVRSLVADLGDAYCLELRRTRIGPFRVEDADPERVLELDEALGFLPSVRLDPDAARRVEHGQPVELRAPAGPPGPVRLLDARGLVALAEPRPGAGLKPVVGFRAP